MLFFQQGVLSPFPVFVALWECEKRIINKIHHFYYFSMLQRDPWDQPSEDPVSQSEVICPEGPAPVADSPSLGGPDSGGSSPYRLSSGRSGSSIPPSSQPYTLQPLEDVSYPAASYTSASSYSCPQYMVTPGDLAVVKMTAVTSEEASGGVVSLSDTTSWAKDDGTGSWLSYETRRAF